MIAQKNDLNLLLNARGSLCSSIYLPVSGSLPQQNVLRARNLCRQAEDAAQRFTGSTIAHSLLDPLEPMLISQAQDIPPGTHGLAGFTRASFQRALPLPIEVAEHTATGYHFFLRPILSLYCESELFHILALSQKHVRLFEADRFHVAELPMALIPAEIPDFDIPGFKKELQFHLTAPGSGHGAVMYHGGRDEPKDRTALFLRGVHKAVHVALRSRTGPVVVAAVNYIASLYASANADPNLTPRHIEGNPDLLTPQELREKAWHIVAPCFAARQEREIAKYRELAGTGLTSSELNEILAHAGNGRVRALFIESAACEADHNGEDLLNNAAIATLRDGGLVYQLPRAAMPAESSIAALYRY